MRLFFCFIIFYSCSNDPDVVRDFVQNDRSAVEKLENAEILHTEKGVLRVKISSAVIERFEDIQPDLVFSEGVEVIFYDDTGLVKSVLKSENANIDEHNKMMTALDNVSLTSSEGKTLETEELIWDENSNIIYTDQHVIITTSNEVIQGEGFESNPDFTEYSISKITGTFNLNSSSE